VRYFLIVFRVFHPGVQRGQTSQQGKVPQDDSHCHHAPEESDYPVTFPVCRQQGRAEQQSYQVPEGNLPQGLHRVKMG
jgi:hypothetical protein